MKKFLKKNLPQPIIRWIQDRKKKYRFYQNINADLAASSQKRVLISYITEPFEADLSCSQHTNVHECAQIIKIFINMGYCVDVIHCQDKENLPYILNKKYHVIFGFGNAFYEAGLHNHQAKKVIYLTESHPDFSIMRERERLDYFYKRHGKRTGFTRSHLFYKKEYIDAADYGILLGSKTTSETYPSLNKRLFITTPTGLINKDYLYEERDYYKSRKNFVWFGSYGAIHKGLDILIDVFNGLQECNLYICGLYPSEERLFSINNINVKNVGFVDVNSCHFIDLMNKCSFVILPSCSEGMSTSVLTCMNHGLIPIVTRETGIDLKEFGVYLDDYRVEYVTEVVRGYSCLGVEELSIQHKKVYDYSREIFNIREYTMRLSAILQKLLQYED
ncbi:glycosyltransferase [Phosphitispora fastidiosa]|uniref:glycosyltransferase n=1 Tax=Phosphitispora fastidiosa TaxID=2837202 RepID=UPI001E5FF2DD|nr:glycosyltransferase [Phosphitispora fastidiosa]MBU7008192.1 glycosyltransferase involved in cell wall biosynthesis [Phosphitispora fastidiosa]